MTKRFLPDQFKDLESYAREWDISATNDRYLKRLGSDVEDLRPIYDAVVDRFEEMKTYLDSKPMDGFTEEDKRLGRLLFAFAVIAPAVVTFKQVRVPDCESVPMFDVQFEIEI